ncbi:unnamed protein product, partial [Rotaria sp. Silwood2]
MPLIDNNVKLDFKDVLIRPKRSTLKSRADVDLTRQFIFRNSKKTYQGIPIVASNMDTVGTFEMAIQLSKLQLFTTIHKHYTVEQWKEFAAEHKDILPNVAISSGMTENDLKKLRDVINAIPELEYICVDVANGYSEHFVEFVRYDLREPIRDFQVIPPGILSLQNLFYFCIHQKNDFIRFVLENSCKTLQQQCPLVKSAIEITRILCKLFYIGVEPNRHQIHKDYFLLFYTISSFFEQAFVRCLLLFNKTWKEMRACDVDFQV